MDSLLLAGERYRVSSPMVPSLLGSLKEKRPINLLKRLFCFSVFIKSVKVHGIDEYVD
jgi:hypothetical protein